MPATKGKRNAHLQMKFVRYDGGTNGQMIIQVRNTGRAGQTFSADGIYFVPKGDPEHAPQRLGAAGPMVVMAGNGVTQKATKSVTLRPGETKQMRLDVFCIDSHRSSPNRSTKFAVASTLLPKPLRRKLSATNARIYRKHRYNFAEAKSEVQANMWKTRDAKWIKLQGERRREKAAPSKIRFREHRHRYRPNQLPMEQRRLP